jgi:hypothetical protein
MALENHDSPAAQRPVSEPARSAMRRERMRSFMRNLTSATYRPDGALTAPGTPASRSHTVGRWGREPIPAQAVDDTPTAAARRAQRGAQQLDGGAAATAE